MSIWYALCEAMHLEFLHMTFMKNALLAVLILAPLFGLLSTMIVTGRMSFFSDALGHSGFTGIAVGVLCGAVQPIGWAVGLAVLFALLRAQPLAAVGRYDHRRVFLDRGRTRYFYRDARRQQLYKIQ